MFDHTANVWMHAKKLCRAIKEHLFSGWKGPFTRVCPEKKKKKQLAQKLNLQDMTANKLITIHLGEGTSGIQQETKQPRCPLCFHIKTAIRKKALEPAMEPAFYQTRCRLAVLRKLHNTMQDLVCGDSVKNHVQPGEAQQIETCWISINFSVQRNFTGQIIASLMTWVCPMQIVMSRKGRGASTYLLCQCSDRT